MSIIYNKEMFVFCSEAESKGIIGFVNNLSSKAESEGMECRYDYGCYDTTHKGIMISYQKRNNHLNDFVPIEAKYRTLWMSIGDGDCSYTNDVEHEIFPMYILESIGFNSVFELTNALETLGITFDSTQPDPESNPEEFIDWVMDADPDLYLEYVYNEDEMPSYHYSY